MSSAPSKKKPSAIPVRGAPFLQRPKSLNSLALLERHEIKTSNFVGEGTYSYVYEVFKFALDAPSTTGSDEVEAPCPLRQQLQQTAYDPQSNRYKYVLKQLKPDLLKRPKVFQDAARDLMTEANILSQLDHPHILRLHGMAKGIVRTQAYGVCKDPETSFFLVTEKLQETLGDRIHRWRRQQPRQGGTSRRLFREKIQMALQIGQALEYIHARRLVFRDLKPHNIGIDSDGQMRLLDFGFCRKLPEPMSLLYSQCGGACMPHNAHDIDVTVDEEDALYHMSGKGTLVYMAPEIFQHAIYNQKADVYSWSMVFYELLTLQHPFPNYIMEEHRLRVGAMRERPNLVDYPDTIPPPVQFLLQKCWKSEIVHRFNMTRACRYLSAICRDFQHGDDDDLMLSTSASRSAPTPQASTSTCHIMDQESMAGCNFYEAFWDCAVGAQSVYVDLTHGLLGGMEPQPRTFFEKSSFQEHQEEDDCVGGGNRSTPEDKATKPRSALSPYAHKESIEVSVEELPNFESQGMDSSTTATTTNTRIVPKPQASTTRIRFVRKLSDSPTSVVKLASMCDPEPSDDDWREVPERAGTEEEKSGSTAAVFE